MMRAARPWPRLPRGAVAAPSLAVPKAGLDGAGSTLGWWKGSLPMQGVGPGRSSNVPHSPIAPAILWFYAQAVWKTNPVSSHMKV